MEGKDHEHWNVSVCRMYLSLLHRNEAQGPDEEELEDEPPEELLPPELVLVLLEEHESAPKTGSGTRIPGSGHQGAGPETVTSSFEEIERNPCPGKRSPPPVLPSGPPLRFHLKGSTAAIASSEKASACS